MKNTLYALPHLILINIYEGGFPILQMRKIRFRKVK